jgi:hypothetical protein
MPRHITCSDHLYPRHILESGEQSRERLEIETKERKRLKIRNKKSLREPHTNILQPSPAS